MGINMPAKSVIFTNLEKYDGMSMRKLKAGEYIQMSGRAGRRGIDTVGIVVMMIQPSLSANECCEMLTGKPIPLNSSFRLTYNMVVNLQRHTEQNCHMVCHLFLFCFFVFLFFSFLVVLFVWVCAVSRQIGSVAVGF